MRFEKTGLLIVGAGPAGLAPLFAAANEGKLDELLRLGVVILERGHTPGSGGLPQYAIRSDSSAEAFLDLVLCTREPRLRALRTHPIAQDLERLGRHAVPLALVAKFLELAATVLCDLVANSAKGRVLTGIEALAVTQSSTGTWRTEVRAVRSQVVAEIESTYVVLATGAHQPANRLFEESVAGEPLLPRYQAKVVQSGDLLAHNSEALLASRFAHTKAPRVVIVGGSTSAGAVACRLLSEQLAPRFDTGAITLMHRKPLRIFYNSVKEALADGYTEFREQDICRLTGRIFRFSGFRLDSRELIMAARGLGGRAAEPRLELLPLRPETYTEAQRRLQRADLIVAALGYRPQLLPIHDADHRSLSPFTPSARQWSVVDQRCRVLTERGTALHNLFAIGLAVGPPPHSSLGGEAGFLGQINSLWMWQHTLGWRIAEQILAQGPFAKGYVSLPLSRTFPGSVPAPKVLLAEAVQSVTVGAR